MKHDKDYYRAIKHNDWRWIAWEHPTSKRKGLHCFARQIPNRLWEEVRCFESELNDGSFQMMCDNGWTR